MVGSSKISPYNPVNADVNHQNARKRRYPKLKITPEVWKIIKSKFKKCRSHGLVGA
jgi:IS30 family transposase